jgi:lipopolysaccharide biosynthesis glycosyltransferase
MKTAVVTIAIKEEFKKILTYTKPFFETYANKINADFINIIDKKINLKYEHLEKFQLHEVLKKYNRIIYLDCDIIIMPETPNLFDIVPSDKIGAVYDNPNNTSSLKFRQNEITQLEKSIGPIKWRSGYINSGVLVLSATHNSIFVNPEERLTFTSGFKDQTLINLNINRNNFKIHQLESKFNYIPLFWNQDRYLIGGFYNPPIELPYIIHFAGLNDKLKYIEQNIRWLINKNYVTNTYILNKFKAINPELFTMKLPKILDFSKGNKTAVLNSLQSLNKPIYTITKPSIVKSTSKNLPPPIPIKSIDSSKIKDSCKLFYDISEVGWAMYLSAHVNYLHKQNIPVAISCKKSREILYRNKCLNILPLPASFILEYGHLPSDGNHLFDPETNKRLMSHIKFSESFKYTYPEYEIITKYSKFENERIFEKYSHLPETIELCKYLFKTSPVIMVFPRCRTSKFKARNIPEIQWIEIINELINKFPTAIIASIGSPDGAYNINIDAPNYFNGVKYDTNIMLELMVTLCNIKQGVVAIGNQSGTLKMTLLSGCPTFMFGNENIRHSVEENWSKTKIEFYDLILTDSGFSIQNFQHMKNKIIKFTDFELSKFKYGVS